jgi:hypothetical protein
MKNISIPEPCHENWADFTPTQKGAFCGSCQIDVIDFSTKTPNEVKSILLENSGKHLCGRFKKSQLLELNDDFGAWQNQSVKSFQSKFLYACLIVFGMTLFTGCSLNNQHIMGDVVALFENAEKDTNAAELSLLNPHNETDTLKKPEISGHRMGKMKYVPEKEVEKIECTPPDSLNENELHVKGEIMLPEPIEIMILGNIAYPETLEKDTIIEVEREEQLDTLFNDEMIDGGLRIDPEFFQYIEDTTTFKTPENELEIPIETNSQIIEEYRPAFTARLYPNPHREVATFEIDVVTEDVFNIYLYAINGKKVNTIFDGKLEQGTIEFKIDLSAYQAGTYLIVINSSKQKESLRIEKIE